MLIPQPLLTKMSPFQDDFGSAYMKRNAMKGWFKRGQVRGTRIVVVDGGRMISYVTKGKILRK